MQWIKRGKICSCAMLDLDWCKTNIMTPVPYRRSKDILRIYTAFCDADNRGRVGYIDVVPEDPMNVIGWSKLPVFDIGKPGRFDDNGVLPSCLFEKDGLIYLLYSGYQRFKNIPYTSFTGLAVSTDHGEHFERVHEIPILDRTEDELYIRSSGTILGIKTGYRIYYASGSEWVSRGNQTDAPRYEIRYVDVEDFTEPIKYPLGGV